MWNKRVMIGIAVSVIVIFLVMAVTLYFGLQDRARSEVAARSAVSVVETVGSTSDEG